MGEQDAITPLASGVNQGPAVPFLKGTIGGRLAQVAQLVEQRIENPRVTGSIPVLGTIKISKKSTVYSPPCSAWSPIDAACVATNV